MVCDLLRGADTFPTLEWLLAHRGIKASFKKPERPGQVLGGIANPSQTLALPSVLSTDRRVLGILLLIELLLGFYFILLFYLFHFFPHNGKINSMSRALKCSPCTGCRVPQPCRRQVNSIYLAPSG